MIRQPSGCGFRSGDPCSWFLPHAGTRTWAGSHRGCGLRSTGPSRSLRSARGGCSGPTSERMRERLRNGYGSEIRQEPQVAWYARSGRNSCHSCRVRLRPATSQARVSQSDGPTSQIHPDPESDTTMTPWPSGMNDAATASLELGPGRRPGMTVPVVVFAPGFLSKSSSRSGALCRRLREQSKRLRARPLTHGRHVRKGCLRWRGRRQS